jgi:ribosomal-protein-alanine N-acetyltransferase
MEYILMDAKHVAQIAELERLCFSTPWSENAIRSELTNPLSLWIVAVDGQSVAGYVGSQSVMGEADMMNLAVAPDFRRNGIGRQLVECLIQRLRDNGVTSLTLEVRASNDAARMLYNNMGFSQVGRRPNYYSNPKEDALILRKEWEA